jgi:capsular exopolysaccharide synthesis family protein
MIDNRFNEDSKDGNIDFKRYLIKALKKWYWFAISLSIALIISYLHAKYTIPTYSVSSTLILRQRASDMNGIDMIIEELGIRGRQRRKAIVVNEISILKSYSYAHRTINKCNFWVTYMGHGYFRDVYLYNNSPFIIKTDNLNNNACNKPIYIDIIDNKNYTIQIENEKEEKINMKFGERFKNDMFDFVIHINNDINKDTYKRYSFYFNSLNSLVNSYRNKLSISTNDKKGTILTLSSVGYVPKQEADYINTLMQEYLYADLEEKDYQSNKTMKFIDNQISQMQDSLKIAENKLQYYRSKKKIINLENEGKILYERLRATEEQKSLYSLQLSFLDTLNNYISERDKALIAPSIVGIDDPVLESFITEYNSLIQKKRIINHSVMDANPESKQLKGQIEEYKEALLSNINSYKGKTRINLTQIIRKLKAIENQMQTLPINEQQLMNIQRRFDLSNNLYNFLLEKRAEQGIASSMNSPDHKILDFAIAENASKQSPKKKMIILMGILIGLTIPASLIILLDLLNSKIDNIKDIEDKINVPVIGYIEKNIHDSSLPVYEYPKSSFAESFRHTRTQLQFMSENSSCPTILVGSAASGEGKTFTASNLATIYSMMGKKTLMLGLDLRKPKINDIFKVNNNFGLSTFFIGKDNFEDVIEPTGIQNLYIASSGPVPPNPAELIQSDNMSSFFERAKKEFEIIIIDTPPFAVVTDSFIIREFVDVSMFVIRENYTRGDVLSIINNIESSNAFKNICVLVNDVKESRIYGYGRSLNYQYGYEKGYYER